MRGRISLSVDSFGGKNNYIYLPSTFSDASGKDVQGRDYECY